MDDLRIAAPQYMRCNLCQKVFESSKPDQSVLKEHLEQNHLNIFLSALVDSAEANLDLSTSSSENMYEFRVPPVAPMFIPRSAAGRARRSNASFNLRTSISMMTDKPDVFERVMVPSRYSHCHMIDGAFVDRLKERKWCPKCKKFVMPKNATRSSLGTNVCSLRIFKCWPLSIVRDRISKREQVCSYCPNCVNYLN